MLAPGDGELPPHSGQFMLAFGIASTFLAALKLRGRSSGSPWATYIPSGVAFAIGFLNTPSFSIARLIGGIIEWRYRKHLMRTHEVGGGKEIRVIILASGFVLGEGVASVLGLVLKTCGIGVASCLGCGTGVCSGC